MNKRKKVIKFPPKETIKMTHNESKLEDVNFAKRRMNNIIFISYVSRIIFIVLACVFNYLIEDHKPDGFIYPRNELERKTLLDRFVELIFGGLLRWDAQHFIFVAKEGHIIEKSCAFFPFYPLLVSFFGHSLNYLLNSFITLDNSLLIIGVVLNVYIFKCSCIMLYKLSLLFLNEKLAYKSTIFFIFNPATIFFIAPYSECLFSFLTFWTIHSCAELYMKVPNFQIRDCTKIIPFMLGPFTRSNGIINLGFVFYTGMAFFAKKPQKRLFFEIILVLGIIFCISVAPFFAYQEHIHYIFCSNVSRNFPNYILEFAKKNDDVILAGQFNNQPYCESIVFPLPYFYIQKTYWDVGFLGYYKFRKIPNFILAFPILFIMFSNIFKHISLNFNKVQNNILSIFNWRYLDDSKQKIVNQKLIYQPHINVFVVHSLFLCAFCLFFVHIEVSTRMICSSTPLFYWYCASYIETENLWFFPKNRTEFFIVCYCLLYILLGIALFSNFYPWT